MLLYSSACVISFMVGTIENMSRRNFLKAAAVLSAAFVTSNAAFALEHAGLHDATSSEHNIPSFSVRADYTRKVKYIEDCLLNSAKKKRTLRTGFSNGKYALILYNGVGYELHDYRWSRCKRSSDCRSQQLNDLADKPIIDPKCWFSLEIMSPIAITYSNEAWKQEYQSRYKRTPIEWRELRRDFDVLSLVDYCYKGICTDAELQDDLYNSGQRLFDIRGLFAPSDSKVRFQAIYETALDNLVAFYANDERYARDIPIRFTEQGRILM